MTVPSSVKQVTGLNDAPRGHYFAGKRWSIPWGDVAHLLGKVTDMEIAATLGCTVVSVRNMRKRLGITKFRMTDRIRLHAGRLTDKDVAAHCGCARETVTRLRIAERIPPCPRSRRPDMIRPNFEREMAARRRKERH